MRRALSPALLLLAIFAGVFAYQQHSEVADLRGQLARISAQRDAAIRSADQAKAGVETANENIARLTTERDTAMDRAKGIASASPAAAPAVPPKAGEGSGGKMMMQGIAKMFETEDGRKMMRAQMAMGIKMQFGGLAKDLRLDPKVADQVLALLGDRQAAMTEMTFTSMNDGAGDGQAAAKIGTKAESLRKEYEEKLHAVLGDEGMAQLKDYERTANDRAMLSMTEQQFTAAGAPLETSQRDGLMQLMKQERLKTPAGALDNNGDSDPAKAFAAMGDDAAVEKHLAKEEDFQRRVLQAAPGTLNPDQVNALQQSFKQQIEMQRFGVKMTREMFKGGGAANTTASPAK